ncbi:hypothetical protein BDQ17DRAFT_1433969 [Cyathus striatus]|nr:hypothetical protein BDQ17DRAFT_1433969 [Cyathus striatus]
MSDLDRQSTLAHITQTEEKILEVDQAIYLLQQVVTSLQNGKDQLELSKARKQSLLTPIKKLPDNVLRYLFVVCQWYLSEDYGNIEPIKSDTFRAIPWMKRYDNICLEAIVKRVHQWKALDFDADCLFPELSAFIALGVPLPKLESLAMNRLSHPISLNPTPAPKFLCVDRNYCGDDPDMTVSFQSASSLTNLMIRNTNNIQKMFIDMPWEQIIDFRCWENDFKEEEFFDISNAMPNLTSLRLLIGTFGFHRQVILPSLQLLSTKENWMGKVGPNHILDFITTPQLRSFVVPCSYFSASSVTQFLHCSGCSIVDLTHTKAHLYEDSSWMESRQLQNLKKLCLRETTRFESLARYTMQDFAHGIFENILFPELETLEVSDVQTIDLASLIATLEIRLQHVQQHATDIEGGNNLCHLKSVAVKFPGYLPQGDREERGILWVCAKIFFLQASFVIQEWVLTGD